MSYDRRGLPTLRDRLIAVMLHHVQTLPDKEQQAQIYSALEAAYQMGLRDEEPIQVHDYAVVDVLGDPARGEVLA